jgi:CheY-like chemotaxis protein
LAGWVLVADDDPDVRETLHWVLHDEGYGVCEAADGAQALALLYASLRPLVVLLDFRMPQMTGGEVLLAVTGDPRVADRHAYVLMTSDRDGLPPALYALAERRGIPIIAKPFDLVRLVGVVAEATQRLRQGRQERQERQEAPRPLITSGPRSSSQR